MHLVLRHILKFDGVQQYHKMAGVLLVAETHSKVELIQQYHIMAGILLVAEAHSKVKWNTAISQCAKLF